SGASAPRDRSPGAQCPRHAGRPCERAGSTPRGGRRLAVGPVRDALCAHDEDAQLLEFLVLAGWYRTISYLADGLLLEEETWGVPFPTR
ncbi:hypothetical protein ABZ054_32755, partial [Streptomyces sp. NPDC006324]